MMEQPARLWSSMNFFIDHWYGRFSVSKAGWLSSIVALLLVLPTNLLELQSFYHLNHLSGLSDLMARAETGEIQALRMPSLLSQGLDQIVEMAVMIWWSVGAWRSCTSPEHTNNGKDGYWFFKFMIIFAALIEVYEMYDFIRTAVGLNG